MMEARMQSKPQLVLPPGTLITKCEAGRAYGTQGQQMRIKGSRDSNTRLPAPYKAPKRDKTKVSARITLEHKAAALCYLKYGAKK